MDTNELHIKVITPIEVAVAYGFHDVVLADCDAGLEVGDGAGDFQPESVIRIYVRTEFILSRL